MPSLRLAHEMDARRAAADARDAKIKAARDRLLGQLGGDLRWDVQTALDLLCDNRSHEAVRVLAESLLRLDAAVNDAEEGALGE